jgi:peptide/nickel transport system permease protein
MKPTVNIAKPSKLSAVWRRLQKDPIVMGCVWVLVLLYVVVFLADFLAPYSENWNRRELAHNPPTPVYIVDDETGHLSAPYVYRYTKHFNSNTYQFELTPNTEQKYYLQFFAKGEPYKLFGIIPSDRHLLSVPAPGVLSLLGTDMNGRDNFSRLLFGGQISLTIGFLSLLVAFPIGLVYGGISGYVGGKTDDVMMRVAEIVMSIPSLYLLISLAAILPAGLSSSMRFAFVTLILAFIGWAGFSRVIRGMVLSIKTQDFVEAERALGMSAWGIITKHILPQTTSYVIVAMTIGVPGYILAESGLSFLGLGILQPDASWGNMLKEAQEITNLVNRPWMLMPGFLIFLAVLTFNVIGDAVRDTLDPKSQRQL